ncbi:hypothetical protein NQ317_004273 [Molorchus minor]|uniref:Non-structural maintenance of chromosomes element 1 homolog n=1 Tax=Molorchus minor TaxID=1323400 RepID=A0ABQ9ISF4_9CUCU|nr:hypothetical protein NQ317_004273 [Molorchus minor]
MKKFHPYLAQYMLKNGVATTANVLEYCKCISEGQVENMTQLKTLIIELNREISNQFYKVVFSKCEVTNQSIVVWLNTKNDDISKHQISYSALELEYFHAILEEIIGGIVDKKVLNKWLKIGYYIKNGDFIYLGPRLILEFTSYLRNRCVDCICNLCSELVFIGQRCSNCNTLLHSYCLSKYLQNQVNCPCCKNVWELSDENVADYALANVEGNMEETELTEDSEIPITNGRSSSDDDSPPPSRPSSRRSRRNKQQKSQSETEDESGPSLRKRHK